MDNQKKQILAEGFFASVLDLIIPTKNENPFIWDNDPFYSTLCISKAISITKNDFTQRLKEDKEMLRILGIQEIEVNDIVNEFAKQTNDHFFES